MRSLSWMGLGKRKATLLQAAHMPLSVLPQPRHSPLPNMEESPLPNMEEENRGEFVVERFAVVVCRCSKLEEENGEVAVEEEVEEGASFAHHFESKALSKSQESQTLWS